MTMARAISGKILGDEDLYSFVRSSHKKAAYDFDFTVEAND